MIEGLVILIIFITATFVAGMTVGIKLQQYAIKKHWRD